MQLCSEFYGLVCLSADDRTHIRLADTDDAIHDGMCVVRKHILLLCIQCLKRVKHLCVRMGQCHTVVFNQIREISQVTADILQLFSDCFSDLFRTAFSAFDKRKIILSRLFAVHSRPVIIVFVADPADHIFQFFACFIQQFNVLRILDILRRTCCIKDQCACVFGIRCRILLIRLTGISAAVI